MPEYLVTYDLEETNPDHHTQFKQAIRDEGWYEAAIDTTISKAKMCPNTVLTKNCGSLAIAETSFRTAMTNMNAKLSRKLNLTRVLIARLEETKVWTDSSF